MATGEAIGMMDGAFFVGRKQIIDWLNEFLCTNLTKIEQTATGAIACQLLDAIYPGTVPMHKVNWDAKHDYEFVHNYKIVQGSFRKHGINKVVPVESLVRAKYQDNLEFMQWFKRFFELNHGGEEYDALERRLKGKGGNRYRPGGKSAGGAKLMSRKAKATCSHSAQAKALHAERQQAKGGSGSKPAEKENRASKQNKEKPARSSGYGRAAARAPNQRNGSQRASGQTSRKEDTTAIADLNARLKEQTTVNQEMKLVVDGLEKERDFYFGKLRDVEILLQSVEEENDGDEADEEAVASPRTELCKQILKILYATEEDLDEGKDQAQEAPVAPAPSM